MKNGLDKFLANDKILYSMPWIYAIGTLAYEIFGMVSGYYADIFELGLEIINVIIIFGIAISYKAHEKNIMKTLFGAFMMGRIIYTFNFVSGNFGTEEQTFAVVSTAVILLLYVVLFINHLVLGYGHKANPERVKLNRTVGLFIIIVFIIALIPYCSSAELIPSGVIALITESAIVLEILCIETKVDAYKIIRESK